jgi:hypothetical protein
VLEATLEELLAATLELDEDATLLLEELATLELDEEATLLLELKIELSAGPVPVGSVELLLATTLSTILPSSRIQM